MNVNHSTDLRALDLKSEVRRISTLGMSVSHDTLGLSIRPAFMHERTTLILDIHFTWRLRVGLVLRNGCSDVDAPASWSGAEIELLLYVAVAGDANQAWDPVDDLVLDSAVDEVGADVFDVLAVVTLIHLWIGELVVTAGGQGHQRRAVRLSYFCVSEVIRSWLNLRVHQTEA